MQEPTTFQLLTDVIWQKLSWLLVHVPLPVAVGAFGVLAVASLRTQERRALRVLSLLLFLCFAFLLDSRLRSGETRIAVPLLVGLIIGGLAAFFGRDSTAREEGVAEPDDGSIIGFFSFAAGVVEALVLIFRQPKWFTDAPRLLALLKAFAVFFGGFALVLAVALLLHRKSKWKWWCVIGAILTFAFFVHSLVYVPLVAAFLLGSVSRSKNAKLLAWQTESSYYKEFAGWAYFVAGFVLLYYLIIVDFCLATRWYANTPSYSVLLGLCASPFWFLGRACRPFVLLPYEKMPVIKQQKLETAK